MSRNNFGSRETPAAADSRAGDVPPDIMWLYARLKPGILRYANSIRARRHGVSSAGYAGMVKKPEDGVSRVYDMLTGEGYLVKKGDKFYSPNGLPPADSELCAEIGKPAAAPRPAKRARTCGEEMEEKILDYLSRDRNGLIISDCEALFNLAFGQAYRILEHLRREGKAEEHGRRYYFAGGADRRLEIEGVSAGVKTVQYKAPSSGVRTQDDTVPRFFSKARLARTETPPAKLARPAKQPSSQPRIPVQQAGGSRRMPDRNGAEHAEMISSKPGRSEGQHGIDRPTEAAGVKRENRYDEAVSPNEGALNRFARKYFAAKNFGTPSMFIRHMRTKGYIYAGFQVDSALNALASAEFLRRLPYRKGGDRVFVLVGYNEDFDEEAKHQRYLALHKAAERYQERRRAAGRWYGETHFSFSQKILQDAGALDDEKHGKDITRDDADSDAEDMSLAQALLRKGVKSLVSEEIL